eukprot:5007714-Pleurochrysis_carterae.AAC.1
MCGPTLTTTKVARAIQRARAAPSPARRAGAALGSRRAAHSTACERCHTQPARGERSCPCPCLATFQAVPHATCLPPGAPRGARVAARAIPERVARRCRTRLGSAPRPGWARVRAPCRLPSAP